MNDASQPIVEHLKMVQAVITRMAGNSAQMKTWAVSLVTAAIIFSGLSDKPHWLIAAGGFVPVFAFWIMDAKYLHLERCYRALYEAIVDGEEVKTFDLDYRPYAGSVDSFRWVAWSWSIRGFYGALMLVMLILFAILAI